MLGYPCGEAAVDVTSGVTVTVSLSCVWGAVGQVGPGQLVTSTTTTK
jgi:hypothetical protein